MSRLCRIAVLLAAVIVLAGCARTPEGAVKPTIRRMTFRIDFNGPINNSYHYFTAIDAAGGGLGPVPVFPGMVTGDGWVTGSATHYVQYHNGQYTIYRITSLQPFRAEPIGTPLERTIPDPGSRTLRFTIDLNAINATEPSVDVNIITVDQPLAEIRLLDGLGRSGNDFLNIDIQSDRTIQNSDGLQPEGPGDVLDHNRTIQPPSDRTNPLDIVDWSITLDV